MSKFDAAIHVLRGSLWCDSVGNENWDEEEEKWEEFNRSRKNSDAFQEMIKAAIRVLEAAALCDRRELGLYAEFNRYEYETIDNLVGQVLAALPDSQDKEKP